MKKSHFELKNYVTATSVFVLAVVAGILIFFGCVQRSVQVNSQKTLKTNVERQRGGKTERASVDDSGYQLSVSE